MRRCDHGGAHERDLWQSMAEPPAAAVRACEPGLTTVTDIDRDEAARTVLASYGRGLASAADTDARLTAVYEARTRAELDALTRDVRDGLLAERPWGGLMVPAALLGGAVVVTVAILPYLSGGAASGLAIAAVGLVGGVVGASTALLRARNRVGTQTGGKHVP